MRQYEEPNRSLIFNFREFFVNFNWYLIENTSNSMSVLHTPIASRKKTSLKTIPSCLGDGILKLQCNCKYIQ